MTEPNLDVLITQIEIALEEGDLETASKLLESATARFSDRSELTLLARRIQEVRHLARQPTIDSLVKRSQERIRAADYAGAMTPLRQALKMAPTDEALKALLAQTEKAAARHAAAVERQSVMVTAVREIESFISATDWVSARGRLEQARSEHGRQDIFDEPATKMRAAMAQEQKQKALEHLSRATQLRDQGDWHGMFHQTDQALTLDPELSQATQLREEARLQIERLEGQRHLEETVEDAARDVERLIEAGEIVPAERRLTRASEELGKHEVFDALEERLDNAKKSQDIQRRSEWADRRTREADALIQEAARQALGNHFEEALEKLSAARQLDPDHSDIDSRQRDYEAALSRRQAKEERSTAFDLAARKVDSALDALRLEEARSLLRSGRAQFGEHRRWEILENRLKGLAQAEQAADELPTPENLAGYGIAAKQTIRGRERTVAGAYSWKQAVLYPIRSPALLVGCIALSALCASVAQLVEGITAAGISWLIPLFALFTTPILVSATLDGKNQPSELAGWWRGTVTLSDGLRLLTFLGLAGAPLWFLLIAGDRLVAETPLTTALWWLLIALLLWLLCVLTVQACGIVSAFGPRHLWRFGRHASVLTSDPPADASLWLTADVLFVLGVSLVMLRVTVMQWAPVMGVPMVALLEGYGLLLVPHLMGLAIRSRRLDWASAYV